MGNFLCCEKTPSFLQKGNKKKIPSQSCHHSKLNSKFTCSECQKEGQLSSMRLASTHQCQFQTVSLDKSEYKICSLCQKENPIPSFSFLSIKEHLKKNKYIEIQLDPQVKIIVYKNHNLMPKEFELNLMLLDIIAKQLKNIRYFSSLNLQFILLSISQSQFADVSSILVAYKEINLLSLSFRSCELQNEGLKCLSLALSQFKQLKSLDLDFYNNNLSFEGVHFLSEALRKLYQITELKINLSCNEIRNGIESVCSAFTQYKNLVTFELDIRLVKISSLSPISSLISNLDYLEYFSLTLWNNDISNQDYKQLSSAISKRKLLKSLTLDLRYTKMEVGGAISLSCAIGELQQLKELKLLLSNNEMRDKGVLSFQNQLPKLKQLNYLLLNIKQNNISNQVVSNLTMIIDLLPIEQTQLFVNQKKEKNSLDFFY